MFYPANNRKTILGEEKLTNRPIVSVIGDNHMEHSGAKWNVAEHTEEVPSKIQQEAKCLQSQMAKIETERGFWDRSSRLS